MKILLKCCFLMGFIIKIMATDDPNFFTWNGGQYYHGTIEKSWSEARNVCRTIWGPENGDLVTINDAEENQYLYQKCYSPHMAWIGANDLQSEGDFVWADNSPMNFTRWNNGEPNNRRGEDCVHFIKDYDGKWNDADCLVKMWFICEKFHGETTNYDKVDSGCDSPKLQTGAQGNFNSMNYPSDYKSMANCGWLITVAPSNKIELQFNENFEIEKGIYSNKCYDSLEVYEGSNSNGEKIGLYCGKSAPRTITSKTNQVFVKFTSDVSFDYTGFRIQWSAVESTSGNISDVANFFTWNGGEYYRGTKESSWEEARDACRAIWGEKNGDLVTINNAEENEYVFNLVRRDNEYMAWIGANDIESEGEFVWADGSKMEFSNWRWGEPNNENNEDCVNFRGEWNGRWNDIPCNINMWFVCERKKKDQ